MPAGSRTPPEPASTTTSVSSSPRRRARPGLAPRPATPPGDRLLRGPVDRADPRPLRRHPRVSGGGDPAVPRHRPPPRSTRWPKVKVRDRRVRTAMGSSPPARPVSGSRSPADASRPGRSGSGPSSSLPGRSPAGSAAKTSTPRTPATGSKVDSHLARRRVNTPAALAVRVAGSVRVALEPDGGGASVTRPAPSQARPVLSRPGPPPGGGSLER